MFTDDSLITFGQYKFTKLCRVPAEYLLELFAKKNYKKNKELLEYIEANLEKIKARKEGKIISPEFKYPCEKQIFASEKSAKEEINRIHGLNQENKKPVRVYECEKCGAWHLTSIPYERWEKIKPHNPH